MKLTREQEQILDLMASVLFDFSTKELAICK